MAEGLQGIWEDINRNLVVQAYTYEDSSSYPDLPIVTEFTVKNTGQSSQTGFEVFFDVVSLTVETPSTHHVERHTNLAGGESFTYKHRSRYSDLGRIMFNIDGEVSPSRLLRVQRKVINVPSSQTRLSIKSYVEVVKDINIRRWLNDVIEPMQIPQPETTEAEINAQQDKLRQAEKEISDTRRQLENIYPFIVRQNDSERTKVSQHRKLLEDYLKHIDTVCSELRKALETHKARTIDAARKRFVDNLSEEVDSIDLASQNLLK